MRWTVAVRGVRQRVDSKALHRLAQPVDLPGAPDARDTNFTLRRSAQRIKCVLPTGLCDVMID